MVSAFQPPHKHLRDDEGEEATAQPVKTTKQTAISLDTADETEDEEVKLTCSGGIPPDSDYDSSSDDEEEDAEASDEKEASDDEELDIDDELLEDLDLEIIDQSFDNTCNMHLLVREGVYEIFSIKISEIEQAKEIND